MVDSTRFPTHGEAHVIRRYRICQAGLAVVQEPQIPMIWSQCKYFFIYKNFLDKVNHANFTDTDLSTRKLWHQLPDDSLTLSILSVPSPTSFYPDWMQQYHSLAPTLLGQVFQRSKLTIQDKPDCFHTYSKSHNNIML